MHVASPVSLQFPPCSSATSLLVPPMSKVMRFSKPAMRPMACAATTPVLGPDSTVRTGSSTPPHRSRSRRRSTA
jgi:hypothetical protein